MKLNRITGKECEIKLPNTSNIKLRKNSVGECAHKASDTPWFAPCLAAYVTNSLNIIQEIVIITIILIILNSFTNSTSKTISFEADLLLT